MLHRALGDAKRLGRLGVGHPDKITELHDLGFERMRGGEFVERVVDGKELIIVVVEGHVRLRDIHALLAAAVAEGAFTAGPVDENPAHCFGRRHKEMSAVIKGWISVRDQSQPGLVNQSCGLERLSRRFVGDFVRRQPAQLLVNQRQPLIGAPGTGRVNRIEKSG